MQPRSKFLIHLTYVIDLPLPHLLLLVSSTQPKSICHLSITIESLRNGILWEASLLEWLVSCIVADNMADEQSIGQAMSNVVGTTQLVSHGVADAKEGIGECHTSDSGSIVHLLTGHWISCTILVRAGQVLKDCLDGLQRQTCSTKAQTNFLILG